MKTMRTIKISLALILAANFAGAQINILDTSFYSPVLDQVKMVDVYLPPGYDANAELYYPVIYYLHPSNGNQTSLSSVTSNLNYLINNKTVGPAIMVCADNTTQPFGISMFVNSILWGDYETYMTEDLIAWVDSSFRTVPDKCHRALLGDGGSGGYGAFRYGIQHKDKFCALAAHAAGPLNMPLYQDDIKADIALENQPGPPYFYNFNNTGPSTQATFIFSAAFSPDTNTQQTYINPPLVNFPFNDSCNLIDSVFYMDWMPNDIINLIDSLEPTDSVGIFFGCGSNDEFHLYQAAVAFQDTLDTLGFAYEFFSHSGGHTMPALFKQKAFIFLDSLLGPVVNTNIRPYEKSTQLTIYPNPATEHITVSMSGASARINITIYDLKGQEIHQLESLKANTTIDISSLKNGVYILKAVDDKHVGFGKFIKE